MSKDIGMGIRFGCFLGILSLYVFSFFKCFCGLFRSFLGGGGEFGCAASSRSYIELLGMYTYNIYSGDRLSQ